MDLFRKHASVKEQIRNVESKVVAGEVTPGQGADILIRKFVKDLWYITILKKENAENMNVHISVFYIMWTCLNLISV